jgi:hypothetical protein
MAAVHGKMEVRVRTFATIANFSVVPPLFSCLSKMRPPPLPSSLQQQPRRIMKVLFTSIALLVGASAFSPRAFVVSKQSNGKLRQAKQDSY